VRSSERVRVRLTHWWVWRLGRGGSGGGEGGGIRVLTAVQPCRAKTPASAPGGRGRSDAHRHRLKNMGAAAGRCGGGGRDCGGCGGGGAPGGAAAGGGRGGRHPPPRHPPYRWLLARPGSVARTYAAKVVAHVRMLTERERDSLSARFASYKRMLPRAAGGVVACGVLFEVQFLRCLLFDECAAADGDGGGGDGGGDPSDGACDGVGGGGTPSSSAKSGESTFWLLFDSSLLLYSVSVLLGHRAEELFVEVAGAARDGFAARPISTTAAAALLPLSTNGRDAPTAANRARVYGPNALDAPVRPVWRLFVTELLNHEFLFQVASVSVRLAEHSFLYVAMNLATSVLGAALEEAELSACASRLERLPAGDGNGAIVEVYREGAPVAVPVCALVPGDVIRLRSDAPARTY